MDFVMLYFSKYWTVQKVYRRHLSHNTTSFDETKNFPQNRQFFFPKFRRSIFFVARRVEILPATTAPQLLLDAGSDEITGAEGTGTFETGIGCIELGREAAAVASPLKYKTIKFRRSTFAQQSGQAGFLKIFKNDL